MNFENPIFEEHGCSTVVDGEGYFNEWRRYFSVRQSEFLYNEVYISPPIGWKNHCIWGSSYASDELYTGNMSFERICEDFLMGGDNFLLTTHRFEVNKMMTATKFSFHLGLNFRQWAGYSNELIVIDLDNWKTIIFDEDLEYTLLCRPDSVDSNVPDMDVALVRGFKNFLLEFGVGMLDPALKAHLSEEIIPLCLESTEWQRLVPRT